MQPRRSDSAGNFHVKMYVRIRGAFKLGYLPQSPANSFPQNPKSHSYSRSPPSPPSPPPSVPLRQLIINHIALDGRLDKVAGRGLGDLVLSGPLADGVEVAARVAGVEVDVGKGFVGRLELHPHLAHHPDVRVAHERLAKVVEAVCWRGVSVRLEKTCLEALVLLTDVLPNDLVRIDPGALALAVVVVVIIVKSLPQEVQTVQVVQALDVRDEAAAVLVAHLDLVGEQVGPGGLLGRHDEGAVWRCEWKCQSTKEKKRSLVLGLGNEAES